MSIEAHLLRRSEKWDPTLSLIRGSFWVGACFGVVAFLDQPAMEISQLAQGQGVRSLRARQSGYPSFVGFNPNLLGRMTQTVERLRRQEVPGTRLPFAEKGPSRTKTETERRMFCTHCGRKWVFATQHIRCSTCSICLKYYVSV